MRQPVATGLPRSPTHTSVFHPIQAEQTRTKSSSPSQTPHSRVSNAGTVQLNTPVPLTQFTCHYSRPRPRPSSSALSLPTTPTRSTKPDTEARRKGTPYPKARNRCSMDTVYQYFRCGSPRATAGQSRCKTRNVCLSGWRPGVPGRIWRELRKRKYLSFAGRTGHRVHHACSPLPGTSRVFPAVLRKTVPRHEERRRAGTPSHQPRTPPALRRRSRHQPASPDGTRGPRVTRSPCRKTPPQD